MHVINQILDQILNIRSTDFPQAHQIGFPWKEQKDAIGESVAQSKRVKMQQKTGALRK